MFGLLPYSTTPTTHPIITFNLTISLLGTAVKQTPFPTYNQCAGLDGEDGKVSIADIPASAFMRTIGIGNMKSGGKRPELNYFAWNSENKYGSSTNFPIRPVICLNVHLTSHVQLRTMEMKIGFINIRRPRR